MGIAFTNAINRYTKHRCRLITTAEKYGFDYEKDIHLPDIVDDDFNEIDQLLRDSDIIHFHILADENTELGPIKVKDHVNGKFVIHHHHGHPDFRAHPEKYREKYRRLKRKVLVSTPDLLQMVPEAVWQPNLVPVDDPLMLPESPPVNGSITVGQSVTRKDLKNTQDLLETIAAINSKRPEPLIKPEIIEDTEYRECLVRKNKCHIVFDHMQGYYGVSSLESLSQGKPVIAGLDDFTISQIQDYFGTSDLPWVIARSRKDLENRMEEISGDLCLLDTLGHQSRRFMVNFWSDRFVAERLSEFYLKL